MPCIHLIDLERFPLTRCGVDTNEKTGALWTDGDDPEVEASCKNCLKLRDGKQMGAPPPQHGGKAEKAEKAQEEAESDRAEGKPISAKHAALLPYWKRATQMERLQARIKSLMSDARTAFGDILVEEEMEHLVEMIEYLDAAETRADWVVAQVLHRLNLEAHKKEDTGVENG
jgi:hypothetical protein